MAFLRRHIAPPTHCVPMNVELMHVELILATGSRAGLTAPLSNGFYMIGRHAECQIRPKSKSVSRRHCVLFRDEETLKVLDLESTSGTKINHQRIEPRAWYELKQGDELSCGKICFRVAIKMERDSLEQERKQDNVQERKQKQTVARHTEATPVGDAAVAVEAAGAHMVAGEAWQAFNIADFLESQDDADRQRRYDKIRESHATTADESIERDSSELDSGDLDVYEDTPLESDENTSTNLTGDSQVTRSATSSARVEKNPPTHDKSDSRRVGIWDRFESGLSRLIYGDNSKLKLVVAFVVAVVILSLVAMQAIEFTTGPPIRVIEDLD